ncbi:Hsp20/alpha crystallin family protein [Salinisphaera aquimarina]|uniref:Hsp20/alpha crystallin family protein n=1 Tax=Salinisphaera aquimarina TaxID=2094031 RepID=A0ABV7EN21_9GAMM
MANSPKSQKSGNNPFRGFLDVMSEMNRAQEQWMTRGKTGTGQGGRSHAAAYVPAADIFALDDDLVVRCELAGVRREDVSLTVTSNVLTISGFRHSEIDEDVLYYTRERVYGEFRRAMILPDGVQEDDISATVRNGLLEIHVRGGAAAKPRSIDIVNNNDPD